MTACSWSHHVKVYESQQDQMKRIELVRDCCVTYIPRYWFPSRPCKLTTYACIWPETSSLGRIIKKYITMRTLLHEEITKEKLAENLGKKSWLTLWTLVEKEAVCWYDNLWSSVSSTVKLLYNMQICLLDSPVTVQISEWWVAHGVHNDSSTKYVKDAQSDVCLSPWPSAGTWV